jgi:hypothetical protein
MSKNGMNASCQFPETCYSKCPCKERAPGSSFLATIPTGRPQTMEFEKGWFNKFSIFVDIVDQFFRRQKEDAYAVYWHNFAIHRMPQSESVDAYNV